MCLCVCVFVCVRERERELESERAREHVITCVSCAEIKTGMPLLPRSLPLLHQQRAKCQATVKQAALFTTTCTKTELNASFKSHSGAPDISAPTQGIGA